MGYRKNYIRQPRLDWLLLICYLALVGIGLLMIYTTTAQDTPVGMWSFDSVFGRQAIWAAISVLALLAAYMIDVHFWSSFSLPFYVAGIIFLVLLLFVGTEIKGARSWISMGGFSIQPAEFAKVTTGLYVASLLSSIKIKLSELRSQVRLAAIVFIPMALIVLQPDPGTAITFVSLFILMYRRGLPTSYFTLSFALFLVLVLTLKFDVMVVVTATFMFFAFTVMEFSRTQLRSVMLAASLVLIFIAGIQYDLLYYALTLNAVIALYFLFWKNPHRTSGMKYSLLSAVVLLCLISFVTSYAFDHLLKPHQQDRINVWLNPEKCDPRGSMYNLIQSKLAIGSGGIKGKGFMQGTYTKFNYVPEQTTDFIFSSIGEEQGFIGGLGIIILFIVVILRILQIGERAKYNFSNNFCYVVAGFIFIHFFINIGMTMGLAPVIGIPLPFISQGGSSLLAFSIMIGIVLKMNRAT